MGDGTEADSKLGPINNAPQFERVKELVADALSHGATATTGGAAMEGPGYFFEPTILTDISDGTRIVDEEQFGPALPVIPYRNVDEVVERANATHFGLSGSVWGTDADRAADGGRSAGVRHGVGQHPPGPRARSSPSAGSSGAGSASRTGPGAWPSSARSRPCTARRAPTG